MKPCLKSISITKKLQKKSYGEIYNRSQIKYIGSLKKKLKLLEKDEIEMKKQKITLIKLKNENIILKQKLTTKSKFSIFGLCRNSSSILPDIVDGMDDLELSDDEDDQHMLDNYDCYEDYIEDYCEEDKTTKIRKIKSKPNKPNKPNKSFLPSIKPMVPLAIKASIVSAGLLL
jgi:hypothetical protein